MPDYIVSGAFVASGTSVPIAEIRTVRTKKRIWWWVLAAIQAVLAIRFLQVVIALNDTPPEGDVHDVLIGVLVGTLVIFLIVAGIQYFYGTKLVIGLVARSIDVNMNRVKLAKAESEITAALTQPARGDLRAQLWDAVVANDSGRVRALLQAGADPNGENQSGVEPLGRAAAEGHLGIVHALIAAGADLNFGGPSNITALSVAAQNGHADVVSALLESGADPNISDASGSTPLHYAASTGNGEITRTLIKHRANVKLTADAGFTPLHCAAMNGHLNVVRQLLESGADIYVRAEGLTAADLAREEGNESVAQALGEWAVNTAVNSKSVNGGATSASIEGGNQALSVTALKANYSVPPSHTVRTDCNDPLQLNTVCSRCRSQLQNGAKFCIHCGAKI